MPHTVVNVGKLGGDMIFFSASRNVHFLFSSDWAARLLQFYNVAVGGSPVLRTANLLPSQPKPVLIYTPGSRGAS